jgi:hypothetical protein
MRSKGRAGITNASANVDGFRRIKMMMQKSGCGMGAGKLASGVVLAATLLGFGNLAHAALVSCPAAYTTTGTAKVENSTGAFNAASNCQYLTPADNSNVASIANINIAGFFGTTNWLTNSQNQIVAEATTGSWSISNVNFATYDYIIVFKDGNDTNLTAFLFNESYSNGVWSTPFTNALPGISQQAKEVSHYTIARRLAAQPCIPVPGIPCGEQQIPEPGTLTLLGIGALSAAFLSRRRRKAPMA